MKTRIAATLVAVGLAGCTVGPNYERPSMSVPAGYSNVSGDWKPARPGDAIPRGSWWRIYKDPQLDALAARVEKAAGPINAENPRLPRLLRTDLASACRSCEYARKCLGDAIVTESEFRVQTDE